MRSYIIHNGAEFISDENGESTTNDREKAFIFEGPHLLSLAQSKANSLAEKGEGLFFPEKLPMQLESGRADSNEWLKNPYAWAGRRVCTSHGTATEKAELASLEAMKTGQGETYSPQSRAHLLNDGSILAEIPITNGTEYRHITE